MVAALSMPISAQEVLTEEAAAEAFKQQTIETGANKTFTREESTASVSVITTKDVNKRGAKNIGNSILGQGNGLISLAGSGNYYEKNATFYVRGLQSLSGSAPLVLVDGIERDINLISPDEVEEVQILKDAAAVALYGYKGTNGAILIKTKRGEYNSQTIRFTYDHEFRNLNDKPKFVNGLTYANAVNEALANEGVAPRYDAEALRALENGGLPYEYPDINWVGETFRNHAVNNHFTLEFSGGGEKFRYFTMANLFSDKGFIKNFDKNEGYSTQDKYVRGNLRTNLDIDLTPNTLLKVNIFGALSEMSRPGSNTDLWSAMYNTPALAYPVKTEQGDWGGSSTWAGTTNPLAQSTGAAYYKTHERALFFDAILDQNLDKILKGLSGTVKASYDALSTLHEDHSKEYIYGYIQPDGTYWTGGKQGEMGKGAGTDHIARRMHWEAGLNYDRIFVGVHGVYVQAKYDYDFQETTGVNTKIYRQNISGLAHYAYDKKYIAEIAVIHSGSSRLAPGTKWNTGATNSLAWVMSNEKFLKDSPIVNFAKLRTSFGIIYNDILPGDNVWTYYTQSYSTNGTQYLWGGGYDTNDGATVIGQMAAVNPTSERAKKFNIGLDATLFGGLNVEFDFFKQRHDNIWVSGAGAYSALIGFDAPFTNAGVVDHSGFEVALDYTKTVGDFTLNIGGTLISQKSKIKEQAEEAKAYDNLVTTGHPLNSIWGLKADGLFQSQAEIDAAPTQTFSTVRPGDIKYVDVNGDGKIDANDRTKIGYSNICPELYYTLHLGAEYKGFGLTAQFQGVGNYSCNLNQSGYYWGLINNSNIAQEVYDNSWRAGNENALYPRLSSSSNANNYQTSDFWLRDRSFFKLRNVEVFYHLPKSLMEATGFMKSAKVYLRGVDLFTSDKIDNKDAEAVQAAMPTTRSIIIGAQLTF